jgi:hypothetical protein
MSAVENLNNTVNQILQLSFDKGRQFERDNIIDLLNNHEQETNCDCPGCESWTNAFEFLKREIKGEING